MGVRFWARRFVVVLCWAFAIIAAAQLLRGRPLAQAAGEGIIWAVISTIVFTASRIYQSRKGRHCALCDDVAGGQQD